MKKSKILIICIIVFAGVLVFVCSLIIASCNSKTPTWNEPPKIDFDKLPHIEVPDDVPTIKIEEDGKALEFKIIRTFEDLDNIRNDMGEDLRIRQNYI